MASSELKPVSRSMAGFMYSIVPLMIGQHDAFTGRVQNDGRAFALAFQFRRAFDDAFFQIVGMAAHGVVQLRVFNGDGGLIGKGGHGFARGFVVGIGREAIDVQNAQQAAFHAQRRANPRSNRLTAGEHVPARILVRCWRSP